MPNPDAAVRGEERTRCHYSANSQMSIDAIRVLKPGGVFGATTFPQQKEPKFWFADMKTAFSAMPFDAPFPETMPVQMHSSGRWYDPAWIEQHLPELGLEDVKVAVISDSYHVESADEFMDFFALMLPFMLNSYWSEEQRAAHDVGEVKSLIHKHLVEKYDAKGWYVSWDVIYMTGRVCK